MKRLLIAAQVAQLLGVAAQSTHQANTDGPDLLHGGWYTTDEVAALIGVDASTLRRWRTATPLQGPPFVKLTSRVTMYNVQDVQDWLSSRRIDPAKAA